MRVDPELVARALYPDRGARQGGNAPPTPAVPERRADREDPRPRLAREALHRKMHPAIDVLDEEVLVGRVTLAGDYDLVTSDRRILPAAGLKDRLLFSPRPYADLAGRWPDEDVAAFLRGEEGPTFSEVLALTIRVLDEAMEFPRPEQRALVAVWSLATYCSRFFLTFPRLALSGERESGKSKLLILLRAMAWNALLLLNPTPAVLFRLVHEFRPTLLLDEVEGLNKEDGREVLAILNSGYKFGGSVPRCEGEKIKRVELFSVYSPLALAAIRNLNAVTEDRSIPLTLQRGTDRRRLNAETDPAAAVFAKVRSGCYRLLLTRGSEVREAYRTVSPPEWLNARARELWLPLLAVAAVADRENGLHLTPDLLALARDHVQDRDGLSAEGEALLAVLAERLVGGEGTVVRPRDLCEDLRKRLGWRDAPSAEAAAAWLRRLGFTKAKPPRDREGTRYEVRRERLEAARARYLLEEAEPQA